jgi:ribosomal protein S18 acetylase RimI-like enzyme
MDEPRESAAITIRDAVGDDIAAAIELDAADTGLAKPDYWRDIFARYVETRRRERFFLIAEGAKGVVGFIVGEVRAWEFGSPPSGWVFAIHVAAESRERGIGRLLLNEICARFKALGVDIVRTMVSRRDTLILSFFRGEGLTAGPYAELEKRLE